MVLREFLALPLAFGTVVSVQEEGHMFACGVYSDIVNMLDRETIFEEHLMREVVEIGPVSDNEMRVVVR